MIDIINHPVHYNIPGKKECIEQMREDFGELITGIFCLTNAYKYLYRAGYKDNNSERQDLTKAVWYYNYFNSMLPIDGDIKLTKLFIFVEEELISRGIKIR